ncbi:putative oxidoreductase YuxG [Capsulimonas corticalis]|uniref:Oxidoreductase YuxG n=1 Tax=Capsulimonas corticalis TaxID=2219043 RepID=A0A402CV55_9BACT|nr:bifunctional aldolase/short-chain dehydrogenase [Capsulimonas corticalis]BDI30326.1 putative oxidoreductase YuxG [Capsulimonas corticalis]
MPINRWDNAVAQPLQGVEELRYRSNLLGQDRTVCNWGGGNTSFKTTGTDFRGRPINIMWVKGSGSDLADATAKNFTALDLDDVLPLFEREEMVDEEMVAYLTQCMIDPKHPRMSIETLLHAFLPYPHVDHAHPDAIISICCADNGKEVAKEIWGDKFVWVDYIRPGFTLSKQIAQGVKDNPNAELVLMAKHGLVTWGATSEESYNKTIATIQQAEDYIATRVAALGDKLFGGAKHQALDSEARREIAAQVFPTIRGLVGKDARMILNYDDNEKVLQFVNSYDAGKLGEIGAACPDHLVHTKRTPLLVDWSPATGDVEALKAALASGIAAYNEDYKAYFESNKIEGDVMSAPPPRVILIPGIGLVSTGKTKAVSEVSTALYNRAIAVMTGSTALGNFISLSPAESFAVEYWPLELYKMSLAPPEVEFSRQIAFITGGGGGIGSATARKLVKEGAHVVLADINLETAQNAADELNKKAGAGRAVAVKLDVTDEEQVLKAYADAILAYGGVDVIVNNAGLATSSPFDQTTLKEWNLNNNVLSTGYFLVAREAFKIMKAQGTGGSMVFVGSKNSVYAGKNAAAYSTAKAAELHLARCIAAEGGEYGIRVNTVLPDAVLSGSAIWNSGWRNERAAAYGINPDQLEEYYRKRTTLLVNILPEDIANSIAFLAGSQSAKTTGCFVTVDGGVPAAFAR